MHFEVKTRKTSPQFKDIRVPGPKRYRPLTMRGMMMHLNGPCMFFLQRRSTEMTSPEGHYQEKIFDFGVLPSSPVFCVNFLTTRATKAAVAAIAAILRDGLDPIASIPAIAILPAVVNACRLISGPANMIASTDAPAAILLSAFTDDVFAPASNSPVLFRFSLS